jgi:hypothetical protein
VFFHILFIAILNLMLGYILAWYLHGPRGIFDWPQPNWLSRLARFRRSAESYEISSPSAAPENISASLGATDSRPKFVPPSAESNSARALVASEPFLGVAHPPANPLAETANSPSSAARPDPMSRASSAAVRSVDHSVVTQAIAGLRAELTQYRGDIATLDTRLRDCALAPDELAIRACAEQFRAVNDLHLESRGPRLEQIEGAAAQSSARDVTCELAEAVNRQSVVIESAQAELAQLDPETELLEQCQQMLDETQQIAVTASQLDSAIDQTLSEIRRAKPATEPSQINQSTLGQLQDHSLNLEKLSNDSHG